MFHRRSHRRSRNPGVAGFSAKELLELAGGSAAGVFGSKYLTQLALGTNNSGIMGYAGQAIATLVLGWAANKYVSKNAATGVVAGGLGALALRYIQENISGTSTSMQGLGDPDMHALGVGMGEYRPGMSPIPVYGFSQPSLPSAQNPGGAVVMPVTGGPAVQARRRG